MLVDAAVVEGKDALAEFAAFQRCERLTVDLHAAVDLVDEGEELRLRALGQHRRAELRLTVVGEQQMLQKHALFLRNAEHFGNFGSLLCAHDEMP